MKALPSDEPPRRSGRIPLDTSTARALRHGCGGECAADESQTNGGRHAMGLFERLFGRKRRRARRYDGQRASYQPPYPRTDGGEPYRAPEPSRQDVRALPHAVEGAPPAPRTLTDEQAIARYRYMLRTAPPEVMEQAHEEAFARLTPQQRAMVL